MHRAVIRKRRGSRAIRPAPALISVKASEKLSRDGQLALLQIYLWIGTFPHEHGSGHTDGARSDFIELSRLPIIVRDQVRRSPEPMKIPECLTR